MSLPTVTVCCHSWNPSVYHPEYWCCSRCGTFKSRTAPPAETIYTPDYWSHERSHSTPEEQIWNCEEYKNEAGVSKNDFLLRLIQPDDRKAVMEIGCSPGALLRRLQSEFQTVVGVDVIPSPGFVTLDGLFPAATRGYVGTSSIDCIIACDVFEHSHEPWPFLLECSRLLKLGGQLILMLPLVIPGEEVLERMFNAEEHVWIHSMDNLAALLGQAGFHSIRFDRWCPGHETVTARKGQTPEARLTAA